MVNISTSECQEHDAFIGLLLFNDGDGYSEMSKVIAKYYDTQFELNRLAHEASYAAIISDVVVESAYDFCEMDGLRCSLVILRNFAADRQISEYYYTLTTGACVDSFSTDNWSKLVETLPTQLEEDYVTCTEYWYDALNNSMGVAAVRSFLDSKYEILPEDCFYFCMSRATPH